MRLYKKHFMTVLALFLIGWYLILLKVSRTQRGLAEFKRQSFVAVVNFTATNQTLVPPPPLVFHCDNSTVLFIAVTSRTRERTVRNTIRKTWGSFAKSKDPSLPVLLLFFAGYSTEADQRALYKEVGLHNDLVVDSRIKEGYRMLTRKILYEFQWASRHCGSAHFFLKVDSDVFVNLPALLNTIGRFEQTKHRHFFYGFLMYRIRPKRTFMKWYMPYSLYPNGTYPNYMHGSSYLMPMRTAQLLAKTDHSEAALWPIEDVFFTGVLAQRLRIALKMTVYMAISCPKPTNFSNDFLTLTCQPCNGFSKRALWKAGQSRMKQTARDYANKLRLAV